MHTERAVMDSGSQPKTPTRLRLSTSLSVEEFTYEENSGFSSGVDSDAPVGTISDPLSADNKLNLSGASISADSKLNLSEPCLGKGESAKAFSPAATEPTGGRHSLLKPPQGLGPDGIRATPRSAKAKAKTGAKLRKLARRSSASRWMVENVFEPLLPQQETVQEVSDDETRSKPVSATPSDRDCTPSKERKKGEEEPDQAWPSTGRALLHGLKERMTIKRRRSLPTLCKDKVFRLIDREGPFGQSNGHWAINNTAGRQRGAKHGAAAEARAGAREMFFNDIYHTFLDAKMSRQLIYLVGIYMVCFFIFALAFLAISEPCGLELQGDFVRAYLLSLETMITIGYGTADDPYLKGCWEGAIVLTAQSLAQLLTSSILIGVIFQGLSRPQSRACTILFSDKACITEIDGVYYFMFRICDLRIHHSLVEPHVRCYCAHKHPVRGFQMTPMRLEHPDDELGSSLILNLPTVVAHRIDAWSPLMQDSERAWPPAKRKNSFQRRTSVDMSPDSPQSFELQAKNMKKSTAQKRHLEHSRTHAWPGTLRRQMDCEQGNRDSCVCPYCGDSFATAAMLELHCRYNAESDAKSDYPEEIRHHRIGADKLSELTHCNPSEGDIRAALSFGFREVIVLVEGIEPTTSSTLQARHSYCIGNGREEELVWNKEFAPCGRKTADASKGIVLNLQQFHRYQDKQQGQIDRRLSK